MTLIPHLVDIGLNLAHDSFDHDRDHVVATARAAGVAHMVLTGSTLESTAAAIELVRSDPFTFRCTAGVHPHHACDLRREDLPRLRELLAAPEVAAAGECGLDYYRNFSSHEDQERAFRWQLELAVESGKPVFLHQRDGHDAFVAILQDYLPRLAGGVAHCFTGEAHELTAYLDLGLSIGVTGWICDERRGQHLRELVRRIPLDRLMAETDAPYLLPRDLNPKPSHRRNEPKYLPHVVKTIAACRGESYETVAAATTRNALKFFGFAEERV
ncbi:MAG TPA: TatD family hydrolase [Steroidobacteraceae bacterium]|nr:TatD family hydrolase [Steroidobacteraceae bacterium]